MGKKTSSSQADAAVFSQLREENAALKQEVEELRRKLERMNELPLNAQRARFGQSSEKREYVISQQLGLFNGKRQIFWRRKSKRQIFWRRKRVSGKINHV